MRPSKVSCLCALALAWLGLPLVSLRAEDSFAKSVGDVKVGAVAKSDVIEVPFILWGGDVGTFVANGGLETKSKSLFDQQGLKLKLIRGDDFTKQVKSYLEGKSPFLRGTVSMLGLASEVTGQDPRTQPVVFLQLTWSAGDHLVSRAELKTLADLKGKKVALQKGGPHVGMLDDVLKTAGLKWSDIKVVWTDDVTGDKGPSSVFRKDASVDGCFAITPDMMELTGGIDKKGTGVRGTLKGAHVLVSTADMKRSIADVYACRKDYYDANKDKIENFAAAYLRGCEELIDMRKPYQDKKDAPKYKAVLEMTQQIYGKDDIKTLEDAAGLIDDAVFVGLPGNRSFFTEQGNLSGFGPKAKAAVDLAVGQGYAAKRFELAKADIDYNELQKKGSIVTSPVAPPSKFKDPEAVKLPTGADLTDNTLYYFTIGFDANQNTFDVAKYGDDFQKALQQASLFGNSAIAVRGHGDLARLLQQFVKGGIDKGIIKRTGNKGNYEYFTKEGKKLDLNDTRKVVELIEKENFGGDQDPKETLKALLNLSTARAEAVRQAVLDYAAAKKIVLDKNQIRFVGVGAVEPIVPYPHSDEEMARNRRVEFRIIRVPAEAQTARDFDY